MTQYVQVKNKDDLVRDTHSNAIVNNNKSAYALAKKRAESAQKQRDEIRSATREINTIKNEMHDIKSMIKTLLDRN
jgi:hypothetical protein|tara:strand:+ start:131 stop:358 length:228 start_codon:yes stop_codon:yes gene_type:complete